jgi:hypothetical protein
MENAQMTYRTLAVIGLTLIAGTALADGPRQGGPRGPDLDQLAIVLELDDYQKEEFGRIMTEHREAARARREAHRASGERPDRETMAAVREQMQANLHAELATVLSGEQLEKLDALKAMRGDRPPRRHKNRDFDGSGETAD